VGFSAGGLQKLVGKRGEESLKLLEKGSPSWKGGVKGEAEVQRKKRP